MTAWLPGFKYRHKFTVDNTKIDSPLTNFPVAMHLGNSVGISNANLSAIFSELHDLEQNKIAVTTSDGVTQCFVEIERFTFASTLGLIHFKAPSVMAATDTDFYLYYDAAQHDNDSYVGLTGSINAASVWDSNFKAVYHMNRSPAAGGGTLYDSTQSNNGTPNGSMTASDLVNGKGSAYAISLDGSNDYYSCGTGATITGDITLEAMVNPSTVALDFQAVLVKNIGTAMNYGMYVALDEVHFQFYNGGFITHTSTSSPVSAGTWQSIGVTFDTVGNSVNLFANGGSIYQASEATNLVANSSAVLIGWDNGAEYFNDRIGEIRLSKVVRSPAWINATTDSLFDSLGTWSAKETKPGSEYYEDLNNYTIANPNNYFKVTRNIVEFDLPRASNADWIYKDFGAGYFTDFIVNFESEITSAPNDSQMVIAAVSNTIGSEQDMLNANDGLFVTYSTGTGGTLYLSLVDASDLSLGQFSFGVATLAPHLYFTLSRSSTILTLDIFTDQDRTQTYTTALTTTCPSTAMRYLYAATGREFTGTNIMSGWTGKMNIVSPVQSLTTNFLTGFDYRRKVTISATDTPTTVQNFPVAIHIGNSVGTSSANLSDVFTVTGSTDSGRKKIAVTLGDGVTQFPVEIERWTSGSSLALLHAKALILNGGTINELYLYYGGSLDSNDFWVGDPGENIAAEAWEGNYLAVWHMQSISAIPNSTGLGGTSTVNVTGLSDGFGSASNLDFNGTSSFVDVSANNNLSVNGLSNLTLESIVKFNGNGTANHMTVSKKNGTNLAYGLYRQTSAATIPYQIKTGLFTGVWGGVASGITLGDGIWSYIAGSYDGSNVYFNVNGGTANAAETGTITDTTTGRFSLGANANRPTWNEFTNANIGEVRISKNQRSFAWMEASRLTLLDNFMRFGAAVAAPTTPVTVAGSLGQIAINGAWKPVDSAYIAVSSNWKTINKIYIAINNQWKLVQ